MIYGRVILLLCAAAIASLGADSARLTLFSGRSYQAEDGSLIRIPSARKCRKLEARLPDGISLAAPLDDLRLHRVWKGESSAADEVDLRATVTRQNGAVMLTATTEESAGFFPLVNGQYELRVTSAAPSHLGAPPHWTVRVWKRSYWDLSRAAANALPPELLLHEPLVGAFVLPKRPATVTARGSVTRAGKYKLSVAGLPVSPVQGRSGSEFTREVPVDDAVEEIEIRADDLRGSSRRLFLPILIEDPTVVTLYSDLPHSADEGSMIQIPAGTACKRLEVRLPAALARLARPESFKLHLMVPGYDKLLHEVDLHAAVSQQNGAVLLTATTGDVLGFFCREEESYELRLIAVTDGRHTLPTWELRVWSRKYWDVFRSIGAASVSDVLIEAPSGGAFEFSRRPDSATVQGSITPDRDYLVSIAGRAVLRDLNRSRWPFAGTVPLTDRVKEIEVRIEDPGESSRRLFLPIR